MSSKHAVDAGMLARMKLEAKAGMTIKHPGVIETYSIGSTGAVNYMVMEFMRGVSLHELVALHGPVRWALVRVGPHADTLLRCTIMYIILLC